MMNQKISRDAILDEIHRVRERISETFGGDVAAILEDARQRQQSANRPVWRGSSSKRKPHPAKQTGHD